MRRNVHQILRSRGASRQGGFTLIEVTIALTVLAIGMLALALMQIHAMQQGNQGRHTTRAAVVARDQLERFQRMGWGDIAVTGGWTAPTPITTVVQATPANRVEQTYNVSWRITDLTAGRTRAIDVRVAWTEKERTAPKTLTLSSVRYNW